MLVTTESIRAVMLLNDKEEASTLQNLFNALDLKFDATVTDQMEQFVSTTTNNQIECFILDWNYANYNIVDLVAKIRKSIKYKKTPIIFVTDKKDARAPKQFSSEDVDVIISRPFLENEICGPLKLALGKKDLKIIPENYNVMILDNNPDILEIMVSNMQELKHTNYKTCSSITEACRLIEAQDFDLFLLDWNLDDGTCIDLIEYIRSKKTNKRLSEALIMVITGRSDVEDIMTLVRYKVSDHIIKPFDYSEFEDKLVYAIDKHRKVL